jgi:hypothetical protein
VRTNQPQEDVVSKTATRIDKVGTVVVPVSDQDRAIEFYVEKLGFEKRADVSFGDGYRWVEVAPADAATTIAIVPPPAGKPTGNVETGILRRLRPRRLAAASKAESPDSPRVPMRDCQTCDRSTPPRAYDRCSSATRSS